MALAQLEGARQHTAALWTANNPVLLAGEWGHESDTGKAKIGDGATAWNSLPYFADTTTLTAAAATLISNAAALTASVDAIGLWQDYTPTWVNWVPTSVSARYATVNKRVEVRFGAVIPITGSVTPSLTVPVAAVAPANNKPVGVFQTVIGASISSGHCVLQTDGKIYFLKTTSPGVYAHTISSTPGHVSGTFVYEAA